MCIGYVPPAPGAQNSHNCESNSGNRYMMSVKVPGDVNVEYNWMCSPYDVGLTPPDVEGSIDCDPIVIVFRSGMLWRPDWDWECCGVEVYPDPDPFPPLLVATVTE